MHARAIYSMYKLTCLWQLCTNFFQEKTMNNYPDSKIQPGDIPLDIRMDNVFKAVFTKETPESSGALTKLVSAMIGRNITIISIVANEQAIEHLGEKHTRFDINCRGDDGERINVEMSLLSEISDKKPYPSKYIIRVNIVKLNIVRT